MKLKGVNPLEQHIEKIVLVAVAVVLLGVIAAQLLLQPNKVSVGSGPPVPPGRAFDSVRVKADQVRARMNAPDLDFPEPPTVNLVEQFVARREAPVAPSPTIAQLGRAPQIDQVAGPAPLAGTDRIAEIRVPAPARPVGYSPRGAVSPAEVRQNPGLAALLPESQPFDKAGVSVEATFSGRRLREALLASGQEGAKAIPPAWWRDSVEVLAVRIEREELTSGGEWANLTTVPPIPGRFDLMKDVREVTTASELVEVASNARAYSAEILRPDYLYMVAGSPWLPPSEAAKLLPQIGNPQIERKLAERQREEAALAADEEQLKELGGGEGGDPPPGAGGGGARGPGGRGEPQPPRGGGDDRQRRQLEQRIRTRKAKLANIDRELAALGYVPEPEEQPATTPGQTGRETAARPLLESDAVRLWAHDITAEPGKVYRYRLAVGVSNPVFGRSAGLVEEQQTLAADPLLMSEWSEWSDPIEVLNDRYFFITSAHEGDQLGGTRAPPRARAEVFEFFYGYYRKGEIGQLEPGDQIVAQVKLPDSSKLLIFDMPEPGLAQAGGEEPPLGGGRGPGPAIGGAPPPPGEEGQPKGTPWDQPVVAKIDCFLLDVAANPGADGGAASSRTVAYLRGLNGGIEVRSPVGEAQDAVFRRVAQSAREGENQGEPVEVKTPEPTIRQPKKPDEPPPPPTGGGGMGGG